MTTPADAHAQQQAAPPVDPGNLLLAPVDAQLTTSLVDTPAGRRLAVTVRTTSATLTVFLEQESARAWGGAISGAANQMSGLLLASGPMPGLAAGAGG